jgi:predicted RNA-binding protein with PUA-like domain
MNYWLLKSEPDDLSIDDLAARPSRTVSWSGVRNFQARNFMREMCVGDMAFFYHSSCAVVGIAGIVEVVSTVYPDATQFDTSSNYFDPKATKENPKWLAFDVRFVQKTTFVPLSLLRDKVELADMRLLAKGSRLSITPVIAMEWSAIVQIMHGKADQKGKLPM